MFKPWLLPAAWKVQLCLRDRLARHSVEIPGGSMNIISQFGAAQRGAAQHPDDYSKGPDKGM